MSRMPRLSARRALPALGLSLALAVLASAATATELYQWKDAQGVTHYSDSPPPSQSGQVKNRVIKSKTGTPTQTASVSATSESTQCLNARGNLKQLQSSAQVGVDNNGDGKPDNVLDAKQRQAQIDLAQSSIRAYCTAPAAPAAASTPNPAPTRPGEAPKAEI
ncbi:DUF4124 domain-containing protein [Pseudomonas sp. CGJS7]|uniref:DUF4124 domain-containing protein n=1 Tax=Pseudomonas sp. CGJS7 TaxID=3109348 RepID=UPI00300A1E1E